MTNETKEYFGKLLKVAQDMADAVAPAEGEQKASPEEVLGALEQVISELEAIANAVPAERGAPEGAEAQPVESPQEKEMTAKLTEAQTKIAALEQKLAQDERVKLAQEFSDLFEEKIAQTKFDEVINSKEDNSIWLTKISALQDYQKSTNYQPYRPAKNFSYTKVAKQSGEGAFIL